MMEELENRDRDREEIFSRSIRAGKRTYFFDVKATIGNEQYLTITESKRRFNNEQGKFIYEKHKLFLYREDFEKFVNGLNDTIEFIKTGKAPFRQPEEHDYSDREHEKPSGKASSDLTFEDLNSGQ
jgi:hypothetical protein